MAGDSERVAVDQTETADTSSFPVSQLRTCEEEWKGNGNYNGRGNSLIYSCR